MITFWLEKNNFTNTQALEDMFEMLVRTATLSQHVFTWPVLLHWDWLRKIWCEIVAFLMSWSFFFRMSVVVYSCLVIMEQYPSCTCRGLLLAFWLSSCRKTRRAEAWSVSLACFQQIVTFLFDGSQKRWYTSLTSDQYFSLHCTYISFSLIFFTFSTLSLPNALYLWSQKDM